MTTTHHPHRVAGAATQKWKANRMSQDITAVPVGHSRLADLVRSAGRGISDRIHSDADDRARVRGWEITQTPGRLGLRGRSYRDPRFGARRSHQDAATTGRRAP